MGADRALHAREAPLRAASLYQIAGSHRGHVLHRLNGMPVAPVAKGLPAILGHQKIFLCVGSAWTLGIDQPCTGKAKIAIEEIDRLIAAGERFGCIPADSGYGSSGLFRQALRERGLLWAVGLSRRQSVYPADVALIFPVAKTGKPRKYHVPDQPPVAAEVLLTKDRWQRGNWRRSTKFHTQSIA